MFFLKGDLLYKKGLKEAQAGNLDDAIFLFDKALYYAAKSKSSYRSFKLQSESLSMFHFCCAIKFLMNNDNVKASEEYANFLRQQNQYVEVCKRNWGIGRETRFNAWKKEISELTVKYQNVLSLLNS